MADHYTKSSVFLAACPSEKTFLLELIQCLQDPESGLLKARKPKKAMKYDPLVYKAAKAFVKNDQDYYDPDDYSIGFEIEDMDDGVALFDMCDFNSDNAAMICHLVLKRFDRADYVLINAAEVCSKPRVDEFGGHAAFVTKKGVKWMCTSKWLRNMIKNHI